MSNPHTNDVEANRFLIGCLIKALVEKQLLTPADIVKVLAREKASAPLKVHDGIDDMIEKITNIPRRL